MTADNEVRERERRQLDLMLDRLEGFRSGELEIRGVIDDLSALHYQLELVSGTWRDEFRDAWAELEIAYAVALDRRRKIPTAASDVTVGDAVTTLIALVRQHLDALENT